jgi:hypothetical protein
MQGKLTLSILGLTLCGCAELSTYNKANSNEDKSQLTFIDAKQRVIYSAPKLSDNQGKSTTAEDRVRMFCAEPSPDALSAYAASLGLSLSLQGKGDASVNQAFSESAANIGVRTAGIQALRDITFRNCESYLNGGITAFGLETMQRRFQSTLVSVLAIEQLTGAVREANVALSSKASGVDVAALATISDNVIASKAALDKAATTQSGAHKKTTAADQTVKDLKTQMAADELTVNELLKIPEDKRTPAQKTTIADLEELKEKTLSAIADAKTALSEEKASDKDKQEKQADYDTMIAVRSAAISGGGSTSSTALSTPAVRTKVLDKDTVQVVSEAVRSIVNDTLQLGFGREVCTTYYGRLIGDKRVFDSLTTQSEAKEFSKTCLEYLGMTKKLMEQQIYLSKAQADMLSGWMALINRMVDKGNISEKTLLKLLAVMSGNMSQGKKSPDDESPTHNSNLPSPPVSLPQTFTDRITPFSEILNLK